MDKICVIVGAAATIENDFLQYYNRLKEAGTNFFVIGADGGNAFLQREGLEADLLVGDFDSLKKIPEGDNVVVHPTRKDDTDMLLAIKEGLKRNCTFFAIFGGLGGREDHTMANVQCLAFLQEQGRKGILFGDEMHMTVIRDEELCFDDTFQGIVSIFALSEVAKGVFLKGLKYELSNAILRRHTPLGVSNEFLGITSTVTVEEGELLVMWDKNQGQLPQWIGGKRK